MFPGVSEHPRLDPADGPATFLEVGTNRLARDLFLLTAVAALFMVMLLHQATQVMANRTWSREAAVVEAGTGEGLVLVLHLRKDGRIGVGDDVVAEPDQAAALVARILRERPALKDARVILNTWDGTPSLRTSDTILALEEVGLATDRCFIRFTQE